MDRDKALKQLRLMQAWHEDNGNGPNADYNAICAGIAALETQEYYEKLITALEQEHAKLREMQSATDINVGTTDTISRQAAVDYCKKMLIETALNNMGFICNADELLLDIEENRIKTWLSHVPPAQAEQPEIIHCKDCIHNKEPDFGFCEWANHHVSANSCCADVFHAERRTG